ncbi:hypothetical protein [Enterococcus sp. AZ109]|uniref:hypothetical protein n=1 Tax=Enterococcus sp. AZ109 TaxID=2774634 RepID=UPI003F1EA796
MKSFILSHDMLLLIILAGFLLATLVFFVLSIKSFVKEKNLENGLFFMLLTVLLVFILCSLYLNSIFQELPPPI